MLVYWNIRTQVQFSWLFSLLSAVSKLCIIRLDFYNWREAAMASLIMATSFPGSITSCKKTNNLSVQRAFRVTSMQIEKPLEELYNVKVERKVSQKRLEELGVSRWSVWKTGKCKLPWDWQVDQLVYIEEGEVRVVPEGSKRYMQFLAGDLVRYPKWLEADLFFNAPYRERYCFKAYGDDWSNLDFEFRAKKLYTCVLL